MFDTICTLPLQSDIFTQLVHPSEPLFVIGLSSGHVHAYKLPSDSDVIEDNEDEDLTSPPKNGNLANGSIIPSLRRASSASLSESGLGSLDTIRTTRRHKGSCRCLVFNYDGELCYSAGTDGLVKAIFTETGNVISKITIPEKVGTGAKIDSPTVLGGKLKTNGKLVAAGVEDGRVRFIRVGRNGVLADMDAKYDELDGVAAVGFDIEGRMVTSGGQVVKVWIEAKGEPGGGRERSTKHSMSSDEDDKQRDVEESSDEEDRPKQKRKKRERNKGKDKSGGRPMDFSL